MARPGYSEHDDPDVCGWPANHMPRVDHAALYFGGRGHMLVMRSAMCSGAIYWANISRVVYGMTEKRLLELTGDNEQNPTFSLPCREVFARGQKDIKVEGPFPEVEEEAAEVHKGYWD